MNKESHIEISTPFIRLDALLKLSGVCGSGGQAKEEIRAGRVTVNGKLCTERGRKLFEGDIVETKAARLRVARQKPQEHTAKGKENA